MDPTNPAIWYAGEASRGIWKSTNRGTTWTNLFDNFLQIGVSGIAIVANDTNIIYITPGDDDAGDSFSIGVYQSIDAGTTWTEAGLGPTAVANWGNNSLMSDITIDPSNSDIIWVATYFGLFMGCLNIWKSGDGGSSFTQLNQRFSNSERYTNADIHALKFHNRNQLYFGSF